MKAETNYKSSRYRDVLGMTEFLEADFYDFVYPRHVHETFAIGLIESGAQLFSTRREKVIMPARELCVVDPDVIHEGSKAVESGWRYRMFYPSASTVAQALNISREEAEGLGFGRFVIDDPELFRDFAEFHRLAFDGRDTLLIEERAIRFLRRMFGRHAGRRGKLGPVQSRVSELCADFLAANTERNVSIRELAALTEVSETQVIRDFSKARGMPPHAFHLARRIERAKQLLAQGHPPSLVAADCGFADQSHLTRHFKRIVGLTPAAFARQVTM